MRKKDIRQRDVRISKNPVTGKLESVILDEVQITFERLNGQIENAMRKMHAGDQDRLAKKLFAWLHAMMMPTGPIVVPIPPTVQEQPEGLT